MSREEMTMTEVAARLAEIDKRLVEQDRTYAIRRETDDRREENASKERVQLIERVDAHGKRTTQLETKWEAFFSEQGAFRTVVSGLKEIRDEGRQLRDEAREHGKKIAMMVGGAIVANVALGVIITLIVKGK